MNYYIAQKLYTNRNLVCENIKRKIEEKGHTYYSFSKKYNISEKQLKSFFDCENKNEEFFLCTLEKLIQILETNSEELLKEIENKNPVLSFIDKRFSNYNLSDCFTAHNCYYFALILKERFKGDICYLPITGHFVCQICGEYYDYNGMIDITKEQPISLEEIKKIDKLWYERLIRDCVE